MSWKPGCKSPNPNGRPKGAQNKRTQLAKLFEPYAPALIEKCVELALAGNTQALKIAIDRVTPPIKDEPLPFAIPDELNINSLTPMVENIIKSLSVGEITPDQAKSLLDVMRGYRDYVVVEKMVIKYEEIKAYLDQRRNSILNENV